MGKRLLYLSSWDFTNAESDGVCKKIMAQIKAFKNRGYTVDLTYIKNGRTYLVNDAGIEKDLGNNHHLSKFGAHRCIASYIRTNSYDCSYIRYNKADPWLITILKELKNNNTKIVIEMPMYPYEKECMVDFRSKLVLVIDIIYRNKMVNYVDYVATYIGEEKIFGIPTIHIVNGIDFSCIKCLSGNKDSDDGIQLIAVALFAPAHGYDRMLRGLHQYYSEGGKRNLIFHMVGDGKTVAQYKSMIREYALEKHVILYGKMNGIELDKIYENADIGVSALGQFRQVKGNHISSTLKSREYCAKGLPIISGCEIDVIPSAKCDFVYICGNDDTPVNIEEIVMFYDKLYTTSIEQRNQLVHRIREYGENNCSINKAMEPIIDTFE